MGRELKYRVWDKQEKVFINPWVRGLHYELATGQIYVNGTNFTDHYELQQYTGLKDKNGREIYEGDVVVYRDTSGSGRPRVFQPREVRWFKDTCNFNLTCPSNGAELEVIGNVHENPDLLSSPGGE